MTTLARSRLTQHLVDAAGVAAVVLFATGGCALVLRGLAMWGMR